MCAVKSRKGQKIHLNYQIVHIEGGGGIYLCIQLMKKLFHNIYLRLELG